MYTRQQAYENIKTLGATSFMGGGLVQGFEYGGKQHSVEVSKGGDVYQSIADYINKIDTGGAPSAPFAPGQPIDPRTVAKETSGYDYKNGGGIYGQPKSYAPPTPPAAPPTTSSSTEFYLKPGETMDQYRTRVAPLGGYAPTQQQLNEAQQNISKYAGDTSTSLTPVVPKRGTTTSAGESSLSSLIEQVNLALGSRPQSPDLLAQRGQLAAQPGGLNEAQNELQTSRDELAAFEKTILSEADKIKGKKGVSTAFVGGKLQKLDADTAEAYRTAQQKVNRAIERYNSANTTLSSMMQLTQQSYENSSQEYNTKFTQFTKFYEMFKTDEDQQITRSRADGDVIISTIGKNPESFKNITPEMEAEWDRIDLASERPRGFIKGIASALSSGALNDFEYKGTFGTAESGYYTQLFNPKTGEIKTVRATTGIGSSPPDITASFGAEYKEQASNLLSAVRNLRFGTVEESKRIIGNITSRLNQGDLEGAESELKLFGYQKLKGQQLTDYDLYEGGMNAFNQALGELSDPSLIAGPYKTLMERSKPWLTIKQDQKFLSLKQTIELGQAQIRKAYYGTAVTDREGFNADKFLINDNDPVDSIKTKLQNSVQFLSWFNDNTIAKSVNLPKPALAEYMNDISPDADYPVGSTRIDDGYLWRMGDDGLWEAIGSAKK